MHWVTIIGIILIAVGTFLTYLGTSLSSKNDYEEGIAKFASKVEEILNNKEHPIKEEDRAKVVFEFDEWANDFLNSREEQRIKIEKQILTKKEQKLALNKAYNKIYTTFFDTLNQFLSSYNKTTKKKIKYDIPPFTEDLYSDSIRKYKAIIQFSKSSKWEIYLIRNKTFSDGLELPYIYINSLSNNEKKSRSINEVSLQIDPNSKYIHVFNAQNEFKDIELSRTIQLDNYPEGIKDLVKQILEFKLSHSNIPR